MKNVKVLVSLALMVFLFCSAAVALAAWPVPGDDVIGMYTTVDPTTARCSNTGVAPYVPTEMKIILSGVTDALGVSGVEFRVENDELPAGWALIAATPEAGGTNFGSGGDTIIGWTSPVPLTADGIVVLAWMRLVPFDITTRIEFRMVPVTVPSVPGQMSYVGGSDLAAKIEIYPAGGGAGAPDFCVNGILDPVISVEEKTWGSVKSMYR